MNTKLPKVVALIVATSLTLTACSNSSNSSSSSSESAATSSAAANGTVTVEDNFGTVEIATPVNRVASTDNRTFEVLEQWGIDLVAAPLPLIPSTISYKTDESIVDLGSHREPNLEALVAAEPDLIISGQRFSQHYEAMKTLNPNVPIVDFEPRDGESLDEELKRQVTELGKIFNKESEADQLIADFDAALKRAKQAYNGNDTVMAVNVSGGEIGYIAPSVGRTFGPVFDLLGLKPALEIENASSNHRGDDISVEAIAESNPQWIFVLDRDGAINADKEGYTPALDVIKNNAALANLAVVSDGKIIVAPQDTYTNESIITYTEILNSIADAFEAQKS
ncbi:periplasmic binding protein [Corynebacterium kutscheri]|uniref:ABC-type enterochelin transport system, periplasmic component n=1 Tax=Corynebacterium kutscheri TaxID=35755 RepID=A0A0F6R0T8_9CORY|nr:ABC transporter substrate-binding protein [Corynebacterium kutscheri]AKE41902.1 ABC-type enterochelin transport system, periplasmic component [Corynebacterium kutscheri]VEH06494.1 periplasmic binding protein [Corynebacterium kutscheri]VEH10237.1 periplasmic binding protein [Corynebacterium kutscheri]VEH82411.1 periplasmic binding protein [Corynebacterium kutscheri]